jgi:hypothetical protein
LRRDDLNSASLEAEPQLTSILPRAQLRLESRTSLTHKWFVLYILMVSERGFISELRHDKEAIQKQLEL